MMQTILPRLFKHKTAPARNNRPVADWGAGLLLFYIVYLGLILPFVCWGAMGTPGHPHPVAHFVFAVPETPHAIHAQIPGLAAFEEDAAHPEQSHADPTGQSRPDTTLISLILLVFVGAWLLGLRQPRRFSRLWTDHNWRSVSLSIPTPPPR